MLFQASLAHFIAFELLCPILFFWASSAHFITFELLCPILFFWAPSSHFIAFGLLCPILFFWASLAHFITFRFLCPIRASHGPLLSLLGFPDSNYHILYFWGLWAFHQPLTHLIQYFGPLWPILTFLHDILLIGLLFLSLGSFRPIFFLKVHLFILWVYDPLFLPFKLNGFLLNLLILFFPYCWASSCY